MEVAVGVLLALSVCCAGAWLHMDRDRAFYPTMLIVVASYYILFAVIDGRIELLLAEGAIAVAFMGVAVAGFKRSLWFVVGALAGHGVLDFLHDYFLRNAGIPPGWPAFCLAFDITAAMFLAVALWARHGVRPLTRRPRSSATPPHELLRELASLIGEMRR